MLFLLLLTNVAIASADPAPELQIDTWYNTNTALKMSDLKEKVVLFDFWGVWCGPCVKNIPKLDALSEALQGKDFVIVTIHTPKKSENLAKQIPENNFQHIVGVDKRHPDDQ